MTQTPPQLKWLIDKRARLQGALDKNTRMMAFASRLAAKAFVKATVQQRAPAPIGIDELATRIIEHFGLTFDLPAMRQRWLRHSVRDSLRKLVNEDLVEPLHEADARQPGEWRWKQHRRPTLAELRACSQPTQPAEAIQ